MAKNDYDLDFDFDKEYGFDPKAFLGDEPFDDNMDLSEFSDEELGLTPPDKEEVPQDAQEQAEDDFDLDDLDMDDFLNLGTPRGPSNPDPETQEEDIPEDMDWSDELDFPADEDAEEFPDDPEPEETEMNQETDYSEEEEQNDQPVFEDGPEEDPNQRRSQRRQKTAKERKPREPRKPAGPNIFTKFYDLYFAPVLNKELVEEPQDPNNPRRRRRKSKAQIFKEVYLPPIVVCVCLILVLSFVIGAFSNAIAERKIDQKNQQSQLDASKDAQAEAEQAYQRIMKEAEALAASYNYEDAIMMLDSFGDMSGYPEMQTKRAEYVNAQNSLVEYQDFSQIPNLSFHALIVDMSRALKEEDASLKANYNKNFVTTDEFTKILNNLYTNGYVLVDFNSFTTINSDVVYTNPIYLPQGKKPVMITETLTNYFNYMIDGNGDNEPDAGGRGFASKLVVDSNGDIKAEYVDASGATLVGDYDLVPILESFIKEHPDFSYRGARAIVAATGKEGVFGYRINSSYIATKGNTYHDEQVAGAKAVAQALRDKGYTIACNSYNNENYADKNANQIQADLQNWTQQITPVIGEVDTFVFARATDISDYSGNAFNVMYTTGFRYFVANGTQPWAETTSTYVRQKRLMVTGNSMAYNPSWFNGLFDCAAILDVNTRGTVPN